MKDKTTTTNRNSEYVYIIIIFFLLRAREFILRCDKTNTQCSKL